MRGKSVKNKHKETDAVTENGYNKEINIKLRETVTFTKQIKTKIRKRTPFEQQ